MEKWITKTEPDKLKLKANMLGYLKVPAAKINEPLLKGPATQKNLKNGVSLVEEGEKLSEQNVAIAGHRVEACRDTIQLFRSRQSRRYCHSAVT